MEDFYPSENTNRPNPGEEAFKWLPPSLIQSRILTSRQKAMLMTWGAVPDVEPYFEDRRLRDIIQYYSQDPQEMEREMHRYAGELLDLGKIREAWQVLRTLE